MKNNTVEQHNQYVDKNDVKTIITFRTQKHLDLWVNEFAGQISDGYWENSRGTEWLWRGVWWQMGSETRVEVTNKYLIGRRSFSLPKDLWNIVGDRMIEDSGFENEKECRAAWREIATAIYNAQETAEAVHLSAELRDFKQKEQKETEAKMADFLTSIGLTEKKPEYWNSERQWFRELEDATRIRVSLNLDKKYYLVKGPETAELRVAENRMEGVLKAIEDFHNVLHPEN